jgi:hypothetical protein
MSVARATCRTPWLGRANLTLPVVRLHAHPMDWLEAGRTGVCYIEPISRKALRELRGVTTIECSDIHTALEVWDWAFDGDEDELSRFDIDATPSCVSTYIEGEVQWQVLSRLRNEGLPIGPDPAFSDPQFSKLVKEMREGAGSRS